MPTKVADRPEREPIRIGPLADWQRRALPPLPIPLTSLIGRTAEIERIRGLIAWDDVRLVTLIGPGGVGKTRLALQVAIEERFDGADVAFVPLTTTDEAGQVTAAIASVLDVSPSGGQSMMVLLKSEIGARHVLVLLDNFEHVLPAAPEIVELLSVCPSLTFLVTSRAKLRVTSEHVVDVPPLLVPDPTHLPGLGEIADYDAIHLFAERAQASDLDFELTTESVFAVAEICRRLDGLPLAIELAAARIGALRPSDILALMDKSLNLLTGGPVDQPSRLQTMRDAVAWSYRLLVPEDQQLFRRLAVFVGGTTLGGATALGAETVDRITSLVDSSLVRSTVGRGGETRFEMLETIREFGIEQLIAQGEETETRHAHAQYMLSLAERLEPDLRGRDPWTTIRRLEDEVGNIRGALSWLFERNSIEAGLRLTAALYWSWSDAISLREGLSWSERFLARPESMNMPILRAKALSVSADLATWAGDFGRCRSMLEEALTIFREKDDRRGTANALRGLGNVELGLGENGRAEPLLLEAERLARSVEDLWNLGVTLNLLGILARAKGQCEQSLRYHSEARDVSRAGGHEINAMAAVSGAGFSALELSDFVAAKAACLEMVDNARQRFDRNPTIRCLMLGGCIAAETGQMQQAVRLLARAISIEGSRGTPSLPATQAPLYRRLDRARAAIGEQIFAEEWAAGVELPLVRALDEIAALMTAAEFEIPPADSHPAGLTSRELDVLALVVEGLSDKEIADRFAISRRTVSKHVQTILDKLDVPSRTAAATYATRRGLV